MNGREEGEEETCHKVQKVPETVGSNRSRESFGREFELALSVERGKDVFVRIGSSSDQVLGEEELAVVELRGSDERRGGNEKERKEKAERSP